MSQTLSFSNRDLQVAKACIAAAIADVSIKLQQAGAGKNVGPSGELLLSPADLTQSNAIAQFLGGSTLLPESRTLDVLSWVDWEETTLREAVLSQDAESIHQAVQHLQSALGSKDYMVGDVVTLADVVIYLALLPVQEQAGQLQKYLQQLGQLPAFQKGLEQALGKSPGQHLQADHSHTSTRPKPRVPISGQRNVLITSALPYVNNVPHLGNIIGCVLSADVYARYCRSRGYNCIYVCGTDEYGTATETKALEEGLTPQQICDKYNKIHADIYEWFDINFDIFGRTPTWQQTEIGQGIFNTLDRAGQLVEQTIEQLYSEAAGKFLADRFVTGTCPKCQYEDARGDQCDSCGNLLNPTELINPKCKLTGTTPVLRTTKHIFLDLPKLSPQLQAYITEASNKGGWSNNCVQVTNSWMRDGLKVRCITRDLKWGTTVPRPGYEDKVFYVWFDAPIGYISITANYVGDWQSWWQNPDHVELVQFMGKDNVPFHTVIFPATLLGTGEKWTLMKNISVTEYLNYEGTQFSKSRGVGVFGSDAQETGIPVEVWRYYLLANRPESADTDFKWSDLAAKNNGELLANLGNFINRGLSFVYAKFGGEVPGVHAEKGAEAVAELGRQVGPLVDAYVTALEARKLKDGIRIAMSISSLGNKFLQDYKPWESIKTDKELCGSYLAACVGLVALLAALIHPYMPSVTRKVQQQLNVSALSLRLTDSLLKKSYALASIIPPGHHINKPEVLFRNITDEEVDELRERYKGNQQQRVSTSSAAASSSSTATAQAIPSKQVKAGKQPKQPKRPNTAAAPTTSTSSSSSAPPQAQSQTTSAPQPTAASASGSAAASASGSCAADGAGAMSNGQASAKKEGKKKDSGGGGGNKKADDRPADISRVDLRVGLIKKAWQHKEADSLYVEEVEVGEDAPRQVVSGLVKFIPEAQMQMRRCVLVCNLKPANMRGVKSHAMVLCATSLDGFQVELVEPPEGSAPGDRVSAQGYEGEPDDQLNPKKKIFEQVTPDLQTNSLKLACYKGIPLSTNKGPCTVRSIVGGSIK
ncbi:hypothetical protein ABBQ32_002671 [Trebouxia sp. C0010 RCD-2024]